ncbi:GlsB/YeaQ/YmgE family stress response membrane protein [bacterium]|nr:MAG: GlsB/YeaQ/YmgE family stress response membrane protein [bacterium]
MDITIGEIVIWVIVGALAGSFTGAIFSRKKKGFGSWGNLAVGMIGALIGGVIFDALEIDLGLGDVKVTFEDLISAFVGSLVLLLVIWMLRRGR